MNNHGGEVVKACKKMHMFNGENIDQHQVMKDVYKNFTWNFKVATSQLENVEKAFSIDEDRDDFIEFRQRLGFFITFSRCMLKRCVDKDTGVINTNLVDILMDVESYFVNLIEFCTTQLSCPHLHLWELRFFGGWYPEVSDAFVAVFNTAAPSTGFVQSDDELMAEFLDQVLVDLNQCDMEDINLKTSFEKLEFFRNCLEFARDWMSRQGLEEFLSCVVVYAESAAYYSFVTKYGKISSREEHTYGDIKSRLEPKMSMAVLEAFVLKSKDSADPLPPLTDELLKRYVDCVGKSFTDLTTEVKNQLECLQNELEFVLGLFLNYPPKHEAELQKLSDLRAQFQTLVENVGSVVFLSLNKEMSTSLGISDLIQKAHLLKEHVMDIFALITFDGIHQNSPKINQLGLLNCLIDKLRESNDFTSGGFQTIHEDLVLLRKFLEDTAGNSTADGEESKDLLSRIGRAAFVAEYFMNSYVLGACPDWCRSRWFSHFREQVKLIEATYADVTEKRSANGENIGIVARSRNPSRVRPLALLPETDVVVGFEDETELVKERLIFDFRKLDIISIIGMAGVGKTTFAKKLYEDPSIVDHFQFRAWCCVSQEYNKKELLLTLLSSIIELTDLIRRMSHGDLSLMLHKQLMGSRYLIVMDDIWGIDAFKDLKHFFPDNGNGSRIMLTSRNRLDDYSDPLELRFLTDDESWDLLKQKAYPKEQIKEECPLPLCQVGKKIAKKCRGLPLAIVVVGGILCKSEKNYYFWEQVASNLSLYIAGDTTEGQVMAALELSYELLPDNLKPLFLYLGAFPEDRRIPANKLMWLWIAEGFVHNTDQLTSLEFQAELNLRELVDRSLVMIAERRSDGRVKSCHVHDLLRDMCMVKAREENFMRQINVHNESPDPVTYEGRLSISMNRSYRESIPKRPFVTCEGFPMLSIPPPLSSFLFFDMNKTIPLYEENIKSVLCDFGLLRILHSESSTVDDISYKDVVVLVHLRYISIRINWNTVPSSISKLQNLETLIIKGLRGEIVVPREIWDMVKLRHLHLNDRADFGSAAALESSSRLENLETLSTPAVSYEAETMLIQRVPNLRKLRCIIVEAKNSYRNYYQLPQLQSLNKLETLKVLCYGRMAHSGKFGLPPTLKKLTLSKFRLQWSEISTFQTLPKLEVLNLRIGAVEGALWDTGDGEFPSLKFLQLESLNIKQWNVSAENFPCLQKLVFKSCKQLEEIPSSVGDFYSLVKIEVVRCSSSAAKSAKLIQAEQRDAGNELLKVQIYMSS